MCVTLGFANSLVLLQIEYPDGTVYEGDLKENFKSGVGRQVLPKDLQQSHGYVWYSGEWVTVSDAFGHKLEVKEEEGRKNIAVVGSAFGGAFIEFSYSCVVELFSNELSKFFDKLSGGLRAMPPLMDI